MKKVLVFILSLFCALSVSFTRVNAEETESELISTSTSEIGNWDKVLESGKAEVQTELSTEHIVGDESSSLKVVITKTNGISFAGVKNDISTKLGTALSTYKNVLGLSFDIYNKVVLANDNLVVRLNYEGGTVNILAEDTTSGTFPNLSVVGSNKVEIKFEKLPDGVTVSMIKSIEIGVEGNNSAEVYLSNILLLYSDDEVSPKIETEVNTLSTINSISFGQYQYGGASGTLTQSVKATDAELSKEKDGSSLSVSISGTGSYTDRIYSVYFPFSAQKNLVTLSDLFAISFWVNNKVSITGGLLFKMGSEITNVKIFDQDNKEIVGEDNVRGLNYTGFRRYEIILTSENIAASELEIGLWGASSDASFNISKFSFIDMVQPKVVNISLNSVSTYTFNNYSTKGIMTKLSGTSTTKSHEDSGNYVKIERSEALEFDISSLYFVGFGTAITNAKVVKPKYVSFYVYNETVLSSGGLLFKFDGTEETTNIVWEDEEKNKGTDRDLNYIGMRKYTIELASSYKSANEFQIGVWGTSACKVYLSDFSIYDDTSLTSLVSKTTTLTTIDDVTKFTKITPSATLNVTSVEDKLYVDYTCTFGSVKNAYIEQNIKGSLSSKTNLTKLKFNAKADEAYGTKAVLQISLSYTDGSGVKAYYTIEEVVLNDNNDTSIVIDYALMPYFLTPSNTEDLRISIIGELTDIGITFSNFNLVVDSSKEEKKSYSYVISDFESEEDLSKWQLSKASGTSATISSSQKAKVGNKSVSYIFNNPLYDFGWTEMYIDIEEIIVKNQDKDLKGLSFYLYNENYIKPGELGFWVKLAQSDNPEYEVKYDSVITELNTKNSLAYTGWNKVEITFDSQAYNEQNYYSGYDAANPKAFNWKKLKYIKIGFWGTYANNALGYSCSTLVDDLRLVSTKELVEPEKISSIVYNLNGGEFKELETNKYTEGTGMPSLPIPTRKGYKFMGWYTNEALSGEIIESISKEDKGTITLYASWKKTSTAWIYILGASSLLIAGAVTLILFKKRKKIQ